MKVLEINNIDLQGRRFNGYDLTLDFFNNDEIQINQVVIIKQSENDKVVEMISSGLSEKLYYKFKRFEDEELSVHSVLSITTPALINLKEYKEADIIHFHMFHNSNLSLYTLEKVAKEKKVIFSFHDPWPITGRCVHFYDCFKWKNGCENCQYLNTIFEMKEHNCNALWRLKKRIFSNPNINIVVTTPWMKNLVEESPITKNCNAFFIPLGIRTDEFYQKYTLKEAKKHFNIPSDNIVLFFRAQHTFKGTNYIIEAMKKLHTNKKITLLTCGDEGLLDELKDKYDVIDLGIIQNEEMLYAYNACDIFLMPSIGESFGLMAVEAMSCYKPVIVFDNTALPSVTFAPKVGVLVNNLDSNDLCDKIKWLINDPKERLNRGNMGRKIVKENYNYDVYLKKIEDLYKKVYSSINKEYKAISVKSNLEDINNIKYKLNKITLDFFRKSSKTYKSLIFKDAMLTLKKINYDSDEAVELIDKFCSKIYKTLVIDNNIKELQIKRQIKYIVTNNRKLMKIVDKIRRRKI